MTISLLSYRIKCSTVYVKLKDEFASSITGHLMRSALNNGLSGMSSVGLLLASAEDAWCEGLQISACFSPELTYNIDKRIQSQQPF